MAVTEENVPHYEEAWKKAIEGAEMSEAEESLLWKADEEGWTPPS